MRGPWTREGCEVVEVTVAHALSSEACCAKWMSIATHANSLLDVSDL